MSRPALPAIPDDLNGIIFRTKDGRIGTLMRPTISGREIATLSAKLIEMTMEDTDE